MLPLAIEVYHFFVNRSKTPNKKPPDRSHPDKNPPTISPLGQMPSENKSPVNKPPRQMPSRTNKETIAKYVVDTNLFRLGSTNPKKYIYIQHLDWFTPIGQLS